MLKRDVRHVRIDLVGLGCRDADARATSPKGCHLPPLRNLPQLRVHERSGKRSAMGSGRPGSRPSALARTGSKSTNHDLKIARAIASRVSFIRRFSSILSSSVPRMWAMARCSERREAESSKLAALAESRLSVRRCLLYRRAARAVRSVAEAVAVGTRHRAVRSRDRLTYRWLQDQRVQCRSPTTMRDASCCLDHENTTIAGWQSGTRRTRLDGSRLRRRSRAVSYDLETLTDES